MRIRLDGTHAEITYSMFRLREIFTVTSVSRAHPDRTRPRNYRVFVNIIPREIKGAR
ncbi:hypothetical protein Ppa06_20930 [Planomonospora parontospora subsp. parontospora]|uniref:Uncharacterized protein n=2 Tax=Planomonospora parontospora TaxID=58119 RepID=A0AA37BFA1_9ACTN|nr:hypothetical protein [Planomonospora parontospora]GGK62770.1 hypothetical protein GCM10010126_22620 [Planomonospora parontospora]GII08295.1 hypothetical protein Ppa06_20930 [Planomonospora parontospora subsp. parontospora]